MPDAARFEPGHFGIGRLFRFVSDAVIVANARTERIVLWNAAAERVFGYSEVEALEMPLHQLVPEMLRDQHRDGLARYQRTGTGSLIGAHSAVELVGEHKDGSKIPIELTLTPIEDTDEDGSRFALAIVRDVSERRLAEERSQRLQQAEGLQHQALELNDLVVQGLAVAKMALEMGMTERAAEAIESSLGNAQAIVGQLLAAIGNEEGVRPGDLVTDRPPPPPP